MTVESFDVAVVGAGPAGSTVARVAAENGLSTVVFDRRSTVGIPIHCGELLPIPAEIRNLFPNCPRLPKLVDIPKRFITNRTSLIRLVSPFGHKFDFSFRANIIDRTHFDQFLADRATKAGADIRLNSRVISRTDSNNMNVRTNNQQITVRARVVIGADGPKSIIAESIGNRYQNEERDLSPALNFIMDNVECESDIVEMYFGQSIAPGGYTWIIPKSKTSANVGFGMRKSVAQAGLPLKQYLYNFIKSNPSTASNLRDATIKSRVGAIIPVGGPVKRTYSRNVVLVGDAAGHVMASNGGGIPTALAGGQIAGEIVASHLLDNNSLSLYEDSWNKEFGAELYTALAILRIADQVMTSDRLTGWCMRFAGIRFLEPLIRCRLPAPVDFASKTLVKVLSILA
ncbi:MAG: geranylgeranyl reductase family protein [Candidatus Thorarchaeota archaeon]